MTWPVKQMWKQNFGGFRAYVWRMLGSFTDDKFMFTVVFNQPTLLYILCSDTNGNCTSA